MKNNPLSRRKFLSGAVLNAIQPPEFELGRERLGTDNLIADWQYILFAQGENNSRLFRAIGGDGGASTLELKEYYQICEEMPEIEEERGVYRKDWDFKNLYIWHDDGIEIFPEGRFQYLPILDSKGRYFTGAFQKFCSLYKEFGLDPAHKNRAIDFALEPHYWESSSLFDFSTYRPCNLQGLLANRQDLAFSEKAFLRSIQMVSRESFAPNLEISDSTEPLISQSNSEKVDRHRVSENQLSPTLEITSTVTRANSRRSWLEPIKSCVEKLVHFPENIMAKEMER